MVAAVATVAAPSSSDHECGGRISHGPCSTVLEWGKERGEGADEGSWAVGRPCWEELTEQGGMTLLPYRVFIRMSVFRADFLFLQLFPGTF